jgi:ubiquitin carboxyl-terminal hydrolase L5
MTVIYIKIHNSFARADPFQIEVVDDKEETEDAFHFIAYIQKDGFIYELDGLQAAAIRHTACNPDEFSAKGTETRSLDIIILS